MARFFSPRKKRLFWGSLLPSLLRRWVWLDLLAHAEIIFFVYVVNQDFGKGERSAVCNERAVIQPCVFPQLPVCLASLSVESIWGGSHSLPSAVWILILQGRRCRDLSGKGRCEEQHETDWSKCRGRVPAFCSATERTSLSHPSSQGSGAILEEGVQRVW